MTLGTLTPLWHFSTFVLESWLKVRSLENTTLPGEENLHLLASYTAGSIA